MKTARSAAWWSILISIVVVIFACGILSLVADRREKGIMAARTGFLAQRGGVGASYLEVNALMQGLFRPGMARDEVPEKLDMVFGCYKLYPLDWRTDEPDAEWDYVIFPGIDCPCETFHAADSGCFTIAYSFHFIGDTLYGVSQSSS